MLQPSVPSCFRILVLASSAWVMGCAPPAKEAESAKTRAKAETEVEAKAGVAAAAEDGRDDSQMASMPEVVFDPRNPPPGFQKCHRNHCHRVGGGVASYQQVMKEIGATKAINVPKPMPMPAAPSDVAAVPDDAIKTESGLAMKVLEAGKGKNPTKQSTVVMHYTAWTSAGKGFDSSVARGEPAMIPMARLHIKGLAEGLQLMTAGEKRRLWIPQELAFEGRPGKPEGMVVFDVQLLEVLSSPAG